MPARPYCRGALDRLFAQKRIFEWTAFLSFVETLPFVRPLTRRWRRSTYSHERDTRVFLQEHAPSDATSCASSSGKDRFSPVTSRTSRRASLATTAGTERHASGSCSTSLHLDGELAIVGRRGGQRLWDLAGRWYPDTETVRLREASGAWRSTPCAPSGCAGSAAAGSRTRRRWGAGPGPGGGALAHRAARPRPRSRGGASGFRYRIRDPRTAAKAAVRLPRLPIPRRRRARRAGRAARRAQAGDDAGARCLGRPVPPRRGARGARVVRRGGAPPRRTRYPTTTGSFVAVVRRSQPSSVTTTMSSIRTPTSPAR